MQIHTSTTTPSLPDNDVEDNYRLHRRFDRMGRLVGDDGMKTLFASHVMVIGLGEWDLMQPKLSFVPGLGK